MNEGWFAGQYLALLSEAEAHSATARYRIADALPGYSVIDLVGWDDFILRSPNGETYLSPTVPLEFAQLSPFEVPPATSLEADARFVGRVKWYIQPIALGGSASAAENLVWVTFEQHAELVVWWNTKYKELKAAGAGT